MLITTRLRAWVQFLLQRKSASRRRDLRLATARRRDRTAIEVLENRTLLSTITVTSLADNLDNDGEVTLREALQAANSDKPYRDAPAGSGPDTIEFAEGLTGVITLNGFSLKIKDELTIIGPGQELLTIDGDGNSRIFDISDDAIISGLTLTGGHAGNGGAIRSIGNLTLTDSTIFGNSAESVSRGGGIYSRGTATIANSTISRNTATYNGGGVYSIGEMMIINSTIIGNTAVRSGGGISNITSNMTITNSTISGNTAGRNGGGIHNNENMIVTNSTISGNTASRSGGGITSRFTATLSNTIVAGNRVTGVGAIDFSGDLMPGSSNNLIGIDVGLGGLTNGVNGNQIGTLSDPIDPLLGPLAFNGGPTQTHALLPDSPAVDAGNNALALDSNGNPLEVDQRSAPFVRIFDGDGNGTATVDIGAFEYYTLLDGILVVTTLDDERDLDPLNPDGSDLSLREAIDLANGSVNGMSVDTITFDPDVFGSAQTIELILGELRITDAVTIIGPGRELLTIDANNNSRIFNIKDDATISGLTLTGGHATNGGAIRTVANFVLTDSTILDNTSMFGGGGLLNIGNATIDNSTISGNTSLDDGGGIFNRGTLTITNSTISGNTSVDSGGGIRNSGTSGTLVVSNSTISENTTGNHGAGIFNRAAAMIVASTISGNIVNLNGGGIANHGSSATLTLTEVTISGNTAEQNGGGVSNLDGAVNITNCTLSGNTRGAISNRGDLATLSVSNSVISQNNAGGGIFNSGIADVTNSTISGNTASNGGGIANYNTLTVTNSRILDNVAGGFGGGISNYGVATITGSSISRNSGVSGAGAILNEGEMTIAKSTISDNDSAGGTGAIYNASRFILSDSTISGNTAGFSGGAFSNDGFISISNSTISRNTAPRDGGAFNNFGTLNITNSTISENTAGENGGGIQNFRLRLVTITNSTFFGNVAGSTGGGINNEGSVTVNNTIVAGNRLEGDQKSDINGSVESGSSNNLIGVGTNLAGIADGIDGNQIGTSLVPIDPQLGPLAYNGGTTQTHSLLPGSSAIDAGSNALARDSDGNDLGHDQRGGPFVRVFDAQGSGLPGRIWASKEPGWIENVTQDDTCPRANKCTDVGVRGAFGFPVSVGDEVVAVFEFYSNFRMELDETLLRTARIVSDQLGRMIERSRTEDRFTRDVTARTLAEEELRNSEVRLRAILDTAIDAILTIDMDDCIESFNPAAENMFGYTAEEIVGKNVKLLQPESSDEFGVCSETKTSTEEGRTNRSIREVEGRRKDGTIFPLELAISEIHQGDLHLFTGILRDISERKKAENDIQLYSCNLEDSHFQLAQQAAQMTIKADELALAQLEQSRQPFQE